MKFMYAHNLLLCFMFTIVGWLHKLHKRSNPVFLVTVSNTQLHIFKSSAFLKLFVPFWTILGNKKFHKR
jgi:hypothetical protein